MTRESLERVDRELSSEQEIEKRTESSECVRSSQESSGGEASIVRGREPRMEACVGDLPHVQCTVHEQCSNRAAILFCAYLTLKSHCFGQC